MVEVRMELVFKLELVGIVVNKVILIFVLKFLSCFFNEV